LTAINISQEGWSRRWRAMQGGERPHGPGRGSRGRGRGRGRGPGGFGPPGFGGFGPFPGGGPGPRRGRARRGDVRAAALLLLAEEPRNGYAIMQELQARSGGVWRASPGSVYPALSQLEDEGLIRAEESGGRREFRLTEEGRAHVEAHRDELGSPWDAVNEGVNDAHHAFMEVGRELGLASLQVLRIGTDAQLAEGRQILADARRGLYRILAEDAPEASSEPDET
jgi:DNA-binding PadR family transcriptional regulator